MKKLIVLSLIYFMTSGCATDTKSLEPSDADINKQAADAYAEVKSKSKISTNYRWNAMVQRVAQRIAAASGENFAWEYVLIESPDVNAWCMPGGKIAVYTGLMPVVQTEGALAAVLGHEVAHATRRHGKQQYARAVQEQMTSLLVGGAAVLGGQMLCKTQSCRDLTLLGGAAASFAITFYDRKFSRGDETEADKFGQIYMAKAGYDPAESVALWERMAKSKNGAAPPEWLSTHPSDDHRRANLQNWLPGANAEYASASQKYGIGESIQ